MGSVSRERQAEITPVVAPRFTSDGLLAVGEEEAVGGATFRNLRLNPSATLLLLDPVTDPRSRDGVRMHLEFLGAEADGTELGHMTEWLAAFAPGRRVARRLLFKVVGLAPYRTETPAPLAPPVRPSASD